MESRNKIIIGVSAGVALLVAIIVIIAVAVPGSGTSEEEGSGGASYPRSPEVSASFYEGLTPSAKTAAFTECSLDLNDNKYSVVASTNTLLFESAGSCKVKKPGECGSSSGNVFHNRLS